MSNFENPKCETCRWFAGDMKKSIGCREGDEQYYEYSECRKRTPHVQFGFPNTKNDLFCGEHSDFDKADTDTDTDSNAKNVDWKFSYGDIVIKKNDTVLFNGFEFWLKEANIFGGKNRTSTILKLSPKSCNKYSCDIHISDEQKMFVFTKLREGFLELKTVKRGNVGKEKTIESPVSNMDGILKWNYKNVTLQRGDTISFNGSDYYLHSIDVKYANMSIIIKIALIEIGGANSVEYFEIDSPRVRSKIFHIRDGKFLLRSISESSECDLGVDFDRKLDKTPKT